MSIQVKARSHQRAVLPDVGLSIIDTRVQLQEEGQL